MTPEEETFSNRFAPFIHTGNVGRMEREFSRAETDIARNANAKIVLFDLAIKLMGFLRIKSMTTTQQNLRKKNMKPTLFILAASWHG